MHTLVNGREEAAISAASLVPLAQSRTVVAVTAVCVLLRSLRHMPRMQYPVLLQPLRPCTLCLLQAACNRHHLTSGLCAGAHGLPNEHQDLVST